FLRIDWTLTSSCGIWSKNCWSFFVMGPRQSAEEMKFVFLDKPMAAQAEHYVPQFENGAAKAPIALDYLLDVLTGCDPTVEYVMCRPARCPCCSGRVTEKTLVALDIGDKSC